MEAMQVEGNGLAYCRGGGHVGGADGSARGGSIVGITSDLGWFIRKPGFIMD